MTFGPHRCPGLNECREGGRFWLATEPVVDGSVALAAPNTNGGGVSILGTQQASRLVTPSVGHESQGAGWASGVLGTLCLQGTV